MKLKTKPVLLQTKDTVAANETNPFVVNHSTYMRMMYFLLNLRPNIVVKKMYDTLSVSLSTLFKMYNFGREKKIQSGQLLLHLWKRATATAINYFFVNKQGVRSHETNRHEGYII